MARKVIDEPFLLIESDLVFDPSLLADMLYPDRIAVARMQPWLNGSTVTIDPSNRVDAFHTSPKGKTRDRYKTVNIYSLSLAAWHRVIQELDRYILAGRVNDYYEAVFRKMVAEEKLSFKAIFFDHKPWYEIDTMADLASAEIMFPSKLRDTFPLFDMPTDPFEKTALRGSVHARS